jgi:hypothetical protein
VFLVEYDPDFGPFRRGSAVYRVLLYEVGGWKGALPDRLLQESIQVDRLISVHAYGYHGAAICGTSLRRLGIEATGGKKESYEEGSYE